MAVRNFWIEADIDGRKHNLEGGPRAKDGEFTLWIKQRDQGAITTALRMDGWADHDGRLRLTCTEMDHGEMGNTFWTVETQR